MMWVENKEANAAQESNEYNVDQNQGKSLTYSSFVMGRPPCFFFKASVLRPTEKNSDPVSVEQAYACIIQSCFLQKFPSS